MDDAISAVDVAVDVADVESPTHHAARAAVEGYVTDQIYNMTGGRHPSGLIEWMDALGRKGITLATAPGGKDFRGCIRERTIYIPRGSSEDQAVDIILHELTHYLIREISHDAGRRIARTFREAGEALNG